MLVRWHDRADSPGNETSETEDGTWVWDWLRPSRQTSGATASAPAFAVIDVETTGLAAACDRVLEMSVIRCDATGRAIDAWSSRFNPQCPVGAMHIHGITAADVAEAPLFATAVPVPAARLSGLVLVAHNARFDLAFLRAEAGRVRWPDGPSGTVLAPPPAEAVREVRRIREQPRELRRLVQLLDDLAIADVLPDDAPEGTASYLELLAEVLEDGVLTDDEAGALVDVAQLWALPSDAVALAHGAFLLAEGGRALAA